MTLTENIKVDNKYIPRLGWEEFNDLLTEIVHLQSFSECIQIAVDRFDEMRTDGDEQSFKHINRMMSLLHINEQILQHLMDMANNTFSTIFCNRG